MRRLTIGIGFVAVLALAVPAGAVINVKPDGDDSQSGASWAKAKATIQAGIDAAAAKGGDVVRVMTGTYDGGIVLKNNVTLRGGFAGVGTTRDLSLYPTVIDAAQTSGAIRVAGGAAVIDGFEIYNGWATYGGAIFANNADLTVKDSYFWGNYADKSGGAIYAAYSTLTVESSSFEENGCELYGGAICSSRGTASVSTSTFSGNYAHCGAAFDCDYAVASSFTRNVVDTNQAAYGGGISCRWKSDVSILNNTFSGNAANYGGALYIYYSETVIANNLIEANEAAVKGGGIYWGSYCVANAVNNTIVKNSASQGGGVCALYKTSGWVANTIFRGNTAASGGGAVLQDAWSDLLFDSCLFNQNGASQFAGLVSPIGSDGNISAAPGFVGYNAGDYHLQATSKAVDAGNDWYVDAAWTDLDGNPRQVGPVDIGCYELQ